MENNIDHSTFKIKILDPVSGTFCAAKWYEVTLWLYMGTNASCHHNPSHRIGSVEDPSSLHNTHQKIQERKQMLSGERGSGCRYCWDAEDSGIISDRLMKSYGYAWADLHKGIPLRVNPKKIEVAFSRVCQLACAYCGPSYSSSWANDITVNGSYNLTSDVRFNHDAKHKLIPDETNEYVQAFFNWWPDIKQDLDVIRFTGGEPLLHLRFWEFLDMINECNGFTGTLIVNSNLIHDKGQVDRLIEKTRFLDSRAGTIEVHTSCESSMEHAEYTRDGFNGELWLKNVNKILGESNINVTVTTAINNMSVWSFGDYLRMISTLKETHGTDRVRTNFNRVMYPHFHTLSILPKKLRTELASELRVVFDDLPKLHDQASITGFNDLCKYLVESKFDDPVFSEKVVLQDVVNFYDQFNNRRKKDISILDKRYVAWVEAAREDLQNQKLRVLNIRDE
jgi:pyruvate-formate lyase-activating enzyme